MIFPNPFNNKRHDFLSFTLDLSFCAAIIMNDNIHVCSFINKMFLNLTLNDGNIAHCLVYGLLNKIVWLLGSNLCESCPVRNSPT